MTTKNQLLGMILLLSLASCSTMNTTNKTAAKKEVTKQETQKDVVAQNKQEKKAITKSTKKTDEVEQTVSTKQAQATSVSSNNWYDKLKKSPFSAAYLNDSYLDVEGADKFSSIHYLYLHYKLDKYHRFTVKPTFGTYTTKTQRDQKDLHTEYLNTELRFTRSSILKESKHGVNYSFLFRNYLVNDNSKNNYGYDSYHYLYNSLSKNFGRYNLSVAPYLLVYNKNGQTTGDEAPPTHVWSIGATNTYSFTDQFYGRFAAIYYSYQYENDLNNFERIYTNVEAGYNFKNGMSLSAYYEAYPILTARANLFETYQGDWARTGKVGTNLYIPIF